MPHCPPAAAPIYSLRFGASGPVNQPAGLSASRSDPPFSHMTIPLRACACFLLLLAAALGGGCTTMRVTDPPRTATEQFLLSVAASNAAEQVSADQLRGRSIYVDPSYITGTEPGLISDEAIPRNPQQNFLIAEVRAQMLQAGAKLVEERERAEIVVELRSGGIGIDKYNFIFGIPSIPLGAAAGVAGVPAADAVATPELAIVKNLRQLGTASIAYVAYWRDTGELIASGGPYIGRSEREDWWFFGYGPRSVSNIPTTEPLE